MRNTTGRSEKRRKENYRRTKKSSRGQKFKRNNPPSDRPRAKRLTLDPRTETEPNNPSEKRKKDRSLIRKKNPHPRENRDSAKESKQPR